MSNDPKCGQCGAPLTAGTPEGLCPACLLRRGFETQTAGGGLPPDFVPPTPAELAQCFPQLEILELLGRGGMGVVYKARQRDLDRLVALKILPGAARRDPAFAERFAREARALARLSHPNIVAVYDSGQTGGLFYFVMEYVDGLNLRQLLASAKMTPREALAIVPQICEALQVAHDQGIVHRDIKPENILLDKKGRVKIGDFGIAKIMGAGMDMTLTGAGEIMGTPVYMAPEQIEHPAEVDHRADIYSLGVVFYQMLTGELPLGKFAPPSRIRGMQIDVRLDEVVLRALEKEPELRYQQASEVRTQVETISGSPRPPGETAPAPVAPHLHARMRWNLGLLAAAMTVSGFTEAFYVYRMVEPPLGIIVAACAFLFGAAALLITATADASIERINAAARVTTLFRTAVVGLAAWLAWNTNNLPTPWLICLLIIFGALMISGLSHLAAIGRIISLPWIVDKRGAQPMAWVAWYLAAISGLIPILFYWLKPWSGLSLTPVEQQFALLISLWAGVNAIALGLGTRKSRIGRIGAIIGVVNVSIWMLMFAGGIVSGSRSGAMSAFPPPGVRLLAQYQWPLISGENLAHEHLINADGRMELVITNTTDTPLQLHLLTIDKPAITSMLYALSGDVRYDGVNGAGYLEMWNVFPPAGPGLPEARYFSRTMGPAGSGPMAQISGASDWRTFELPFNRTGSAGPPSRLEINIFLPGRGTVYLGPLTLTQLHGQ